MRRLFILWAICGTAVTVAAETTPPSTPREWTNASGANRARAVLIRIEGETLWLRRADGKLATTTISNLSERDRQYVASLESQPAANSKSPSLASSVIEGVADTVESIQELPQWLGQNQPGGDGSLVPAVPIPTMRVPAALVYVRVSREFLEGYVERTVRRRKPVRDSVLGARIVGESETRGKTWLTLLPSNGQLKAHILFEGTVRARTRGYKGPVVLHSIADSTFQARKLIALDDSGLRVAPATASAPTRLRTTSISTSLPRLRGRIATRIAWRRSSQSHGQAQAITADRTADDIRTDFDARINRSMANVQKVLGPKLVELEAGRSPMPTDVRFRSRANFVEVAILREDATAEERKLRPPPALANSDISLRVHRTLLTSALADPELMQNLAPLFSQLLEARANPPADAARTAAISPQDTEPKWAVNLDWVSLDFKDATR